MDEEEFKVKVTPSARPYLIIQKGKIWGLRDHHDLWDATYNQSLKNSYETIKPFLPEHCADILDIGSGMGGINALVNRHYGGHVNVTLIDGINDKPNMKLHRETFSNAAIAREFLMENGVKEVNAIPPLTAKLEKSTVKYDLIYSFGAWCFHFQPQLYLLHVITACRKGTVIIVDIRKEKKTWLQDLQSWFGTGELVRESEKFIKWRFIYGE